MKLLIAILLLMLSSGPGYSEQANLTLEVTLLEKNVYLHTSYKAIEGYGRFGSNGLIVIDENKAYVVDTPWSEEDTAALADWIEDQGYEFAATLSTHSHDDRAGGIALLNRLQVKTVASSLTNTFLQQKDRALATHSFSESEFSFVPNLIEAYYPGAGHTQDNLVVWLPQSNILFGGCLVKDLQAKTLGYVGEAIIDQWGGSIDKLIQTFPQTEIVVPGHGAVGNLELLMHTKALVNKVLSN